MKRHIKKLYAALAVLFWIAVWHIAALRIGKPILLPTPAEAASVLGELAAERTFWSVCLTSVKTIFSGALLGVAIGAAAAVLSYISPLLKYLLSPIMSLVKATPIASFIILFLVWLGKDIIPFVISMMMVIPVVASNVLTAIENLDKGLAEVTRVYNMELGVRWRLLYRPSILPYLSSAIKSSVAMAWKAGIATEVLCTPKGTIGQLLYESKLYLETPTLFAWTVTVVIISLILEKAVVLITSKLMGGSAK